MANSFVRKTIYYLIMVGGIVLFGKLLGYENVFYAVTTCLIITRIRKHCVRLAVFFRYLAINTLMLIASITLQYPSWWNLVLIFITIYLIIKCFYIDQSTVAYFPFLMQYVFIIFKPITNLELIYIGYRSIALMIGPLVVLVMVILYNLNYHPQLQINKLATFLGTKEFNQELVSLNDLLVNKFRETKRINQLVVQLNCLKVINQYYDQLDQPVHNIDEIKNYNLNRLDNKHLVKAIKIIKNIEEYNVNLSAYRYLQNKQKVYFSAIFSLIFILIVIVGNYVYGYETRWFLIGLCAMIFPYYEESVKKIIKLMISTILGGVVVIGLYYLIPIKGWPLCLLLVCFYLATLITDFIKQKFFVTMGSILLILVVNQTGTPLQVGLLRIGLYLSAGIVSLFINKLFAIDKTQVKEQQQIIYNNTLDRLQTSHNLSQINYDSLKLFVVNLYLKDSNQQEELNNIVINAYSKYHSTK